MPVINVRLQSDAALGKLTRALECVAPAIDGDEVKRSALIALYGHFDRELAQHWSVVSFTVRRGPYACSRFLPTASDKKRCHLCLQPRSAHRNVED
jgi:hypothetical protein